MKELTVIQSYLDSNEYESVNKILVDYNEVNDTIDINIFWDKLDAKNVFKFKRVRQESIIQIGKELNSYFKGYKFMLYNHYI
jgi:hypothetical protein